jgi:hypothetical protein
MNCSEGRVFETKFMFHSAWPASQTPALRPMRGSGLGGVIDISAFGDGEVSPGDAIEWAHAVTATTPAVTSIGSQEGVGLARRGNCPVRWTEGIEESFRWRDTAVDG